MLKQRHLLARIVEQVFPLVSVVIATFSFAGGVPESVTRPDTTAVPGFAGGPAGPFGASGALGLQAATQAKTAEQIVGADLELILSTMLHGIGVGNMTPSWVKTVCVDINPAVVTKLVDRGSAQAVGIVTDVGLFLRLLADALVGGSR